MPNMVVFRPADANEVVEAYKAAIQHLHGPTTLIFSRQASPLWTVPNTPQLLVWPKARTYLAMLLAASLS